MKTDYIELNDLDTKTKDTIRFTMFGGFSTTDALKYINSGILGKRINKKSKQEEIITIKRTTYFKYKKLLNQPEQVQKEFWHFAQSVYTIEIRNILAVIQQLNMKSLYNLAQTNDPVKNQKIIDSIYRNLPAYTQFMEQLKTMLDKNRLPNQTEPPGIANAKVD